MGGGGRGERAPPGRRGFLAARGGGGVAAAVAAATKMAEGLERVRISASELRGILATLTPQAGSRGESRRPAPGPGLPAPPPSPSPPPLPPPGGAHGTRVSPPLPPQWGTGGEGGFPRLSYLFEGRGGVLGLSQRGSPPRGPSPSPHLRPLPPLPGKVTVPLCSSALQVARGFLAVSGHGKTRGAGIW